MPMYVLWLWCFILALYLPFYRCALLKYTSSLSYFGPRILSASRTNWIINTWWWLRPAPCSSPPLSLAFQREWEKSGLFCFFTEGWFSASHIFALWMSPDQAAVPPTTMVHKWCTLWCTEVGSWVGESATANALNSSPSSSQSFWSSSPLGQSRPMARPSGRLASHRWRPAGN